MKKLKERLNDIMNIEIRTYFDRLSPERRFAIASGIFVTLLSGYCITVGYGLYRIGRNDVLRGLPEIGIVSDHYCDSPDSVCIPANALRSDCGSCENDNLYDGDAEK
jgi:hypothetical protein